MSDVDRFSDNCIVMGPKAKPINGRTCLSKDIDSVEMDFKHARDKRVSKKGHGRTGTSMNVDRKNDLPKDKITDNNSSDDYSSDKSSIKNIKQRIIKK